MRDLALDDCWIGAGFVRDTVWDHLHGLVEPTPLNDVDVIYFDPDSATPEHENQHQLRLRAVLPGVRWQVRNQARMHGVNRDAPYTCTKDAMTRWPETATAVAARLRKDGEIELLAPFGLGDLFDLILRPTPAYAAKGQTIQHRVQSKNWREIWPKLKLVIECL